MTAFCTVLLVTSLGRVSRSADASCRLHLEVRYNLARVMGDLRYPKQRLMRRDTVYCAFRT
jgi:hypothetical protein